MARCCLSWSQPGLRGRWRASESPYPCRRQIEKSPLAQIEMSLSTVLVGEFWADDGDCDEPEGDRPDERVAGSGGGQYQSSRGSDTDEAGSASGVPIGQGLQPARR